MSGTERVVRLYVEASGKSPFERWFDKLRDRRAQERILARIARLRLGNAGDWKSLGEGLFEMRLDYGPGYRIYFAQEGASIVILLAAGTKATQREDIKRARVYWRDYEGSEASKEF